MKKYILSVFLFFSTAYAKNSIDLQQFSVAHNNYFFTTESPDVIFSENIDSGIKIHNNFYFEMNTDYLKNPLTIIDTQNKRAGVYSDSIASANVSLGYLRDKDLSFFLQMAMHQMSYNQLQKPVTLDQNTSTVMGDTRLISKIILMDNKESKLALIPEIIFGTGNSDYLSSIGSNLFGLHLSYENKLFGQYFSYNVGYQYAPDNIYMKPNSNLIVDYRRKIPFSVGMYVPFNDKFGLSSEISGGVALSSNKFQNQIEILVGPRFAYSRDFSVSLGAGTGKFNSSSSDDYRLIFQFKYMMGDYKNAIIVKQNDINNASVIRKEEIATISPTVEVYDIHDNDAKSNTVGSVREVANHEMIKRIENNSFDIHGINGQGLLLLPSNNCTNCENGVDSIEFKVKYANNENNKKLNKNNISPRQIASFDENNNNKYIKKYCYIPLIIFGLNNSSLSKGNKAQLRMLAYDLLQKKNILQSLEIRGHASPDGIEQKNSSLADDRALVARKYLISLGIPQEKIQTLEYASKEPPNGNFENKESKYQAWRRSEFICNFLTE